MRVRRLLVLAALLGAPTVAGAQATDLTAVSLAADTDIKVGKLVGVVTGTVMCNGTLSFAKASRTADSVFVIADTIRGAPGVEIFGASAFNHVIPHFATFLGPEISPISLPVLTLPP